LAISVTCSVRKNAGTTFRLLDMPQIERETL